MNHFLSDLYEYWYHSLSTTAKPNIHKPECDIEQGKYLSQIQQDTQTPLKQNRWSVCLGEEYEYCIQNKTHQSYVVGPVSADIYQFPIVRVIRNHTVKLSSPFC